MIFNNPQEFVRVSRRLPRSRRDGMELASALFEILSFQPRRMRTQVLVWSLTGKAAYDFFRLVGNPDLPAIENAAKRTPRF